MLVFQLRIEQRRGRVFDGWSEGKIYFPPTYKYSNNSDRYAGEDKRPKEKRRTPAWCDRILWYGRGLYQLSYVRGESRFSDHRPVYSIFVAEVESLNRSRIKKSVSCSSSRIEVVTAAKELCLDGDKRQCVAYNPKRRLVVRFLSFSRIGSKFILSS
ncbi:Endonuclease/exonuclease/phosphatase [Parasponia andersonii]|uniref:Endonuclease/exonuclease/phosphatase n=1 Tax=Parasponia andersonii TaxID=3476 RepID=A0A2P5C2J8_PARAD|nr:Endonuclease/exonuclease/phosphatase [Parasponia andersonii]